nr:MAG TPA: hypothetical protein [Bacteriophage sp.]
MTTQTTNPKGIDKYNYISFFRKIKIIFGGKTNGKTIKRRNK